MFPRVVPQCSNSSRSLTPSAHYQAEGTFSHDIDLCRVGVHSLICMRYVFCPSILEHWSGSCPCVHSGMSIRSQCEPIDGRVTPSRGESWNCIQSEHMHYAFIRSFSIIIFIIHHHHSLSLRALCSQICAAQTVTNTPTEQRLVSEESKCFIKKNKCQ